MYNPFQLWRGWKQVFHGGLHYLMMLCRGLLFRRVSGLVIPRRPDSQEQRRLQSRARYFSRKAG